MKWSEEQLKWMEENAKLIESGSFKEIYQAGITSGKLKGPFASNQIVLALSTLRGSSVELMVRKWFSMNSGMAGTPEHYSLDYSIDGSEVGSYWADVRSLPDSQVVYERFKDYLNSILEGDKELIDKILRMTVVKGL